MSDEPVPERLQSLWQEQPVERRSISLDELQQRARHLERRVSRRNLREYVAGALAIVTCGYLAWKAPLPMMRAGFVLSVPPLIFIVYHLRRHGEARAMPGEMGLTGCLQFHRGELERQRDLLRGVWKWYLLPLVPGMILVYLAAILARPEHTWRGLGLLAVSLLFFGWINDANRSAANKLQARIDALERDV
jgi:hypothetical protein